FGGLRGDRHIREYANPDTARTLHLTGDRAASRFDLTRGNAVRLHRLQAETAEIQIGAALGRTMDAALELLAELVRFGCSILLAPNSQMGQAFSRRRAPERSPAGSPSVARRSDAIGSCSRISPLNTQTLTPQVP